jgi:hypothetical protein
MSTIMKRTTGILTVALLALLAPFASAQDIRLTEKETRWRLTAEYFEVDSDENLGLVGMHYDRLGLFERFPEFYAGVGGFTAVSGMRGGFFTGGLTGGYLREFQPGWFVDVGMFAGGGVESGGDAAGLFLRPHLAIERAFTLFGLRAEIANVDFVDEDIDDFHFAIGLTLFSEMLGAHESGRAKPIPRTALIKRHLRFSPLLAEIYPDSGKKQVSGIPLNRDLQMLGFGVDYFLGETLFIPVEAFGATSGSVAGFTTVMGGLGISLPFFTERTRLEFKALAGAGGGGDVHTGSGFMWQVRGGVKIPLYGPLSLDMSVGTMSAATGDFEANLATVGLTWSSHIPELKVGYPRSRLASEGLPEDSAKINTTRLQLLNKLYSPHSEAKHRDGSEMEETSNLLGIGFEQPVTDSIAILGRIYTAWEGDIGGYKEGLMGLKYEFTPFADERHHFFVSGLAGAGGGGGMDVGSGLLYQAGAGYRYEWTDTTSLLVEWGYTQPDRGSFQAETFEIGVSWDLQRAFLR